MTAELDELVRIARAALADVEGRAAFSLAPLGGFGLRLPIPTAVAAAFLHRDLRRQFEHLHNLALRALAGGDTAAKDRADGVEALLKSIPEHPTRLLTFTAFAVMFALALVYFSIAEIGTLLKLTVSVVTLDFTDAYAAALELGPNGLWWRMPLSLAIVYGPAHLVLLLGFSLKRRILDRAAETAGASTSGCGATRFDRTAALAQMAAGGAALPPAAFGDLSFAGLYLGFAAAAGGTCLYVGWIADSRPMLGAGAANVLIGVAAAATALAGHAKARREATARP